MFSIFVCPRKNKLPCDDNWRELQNIVGVNVLAITQECGADH